MRLIHQAMVASKTVKNLTRKCAACGQEQVVPPSQAKANVRCKRCGATLPPKASAGRGK